MNNVMFVVGVIPWGGDIMKKIVLSTITLIESSKPNLSAEMAGSCGQGQGGSCKGTGHCGKCGGGKCNS